MALSRLPRQPLSRSGFRKTLMMILRSATNARSDVKHSKMASCRFFSSASSVSRTPLSRPSNQRSVGTTAPGGAAMMTIRPFPAAGVGGSWLLAAVALAAAAARSRSVPSEARRELRRPSVRSICWTVARPTLRLMEPSMTIRRSPASSSLSDDADPWSSSVSALELDAASSFVMVYWSRSS